MTSSGEDNDTLDHRSSFTDLLKLLGTAQQVVAYWMDTINPRNNNNHKAAGGGELRQIDC